MKTFVCLLGLALLVNARRLDERVDDTFCEGKIDANYLLEGGSCTNDYVQCHRSRATPLQCPALLSFNPEEGGCVPQELNSNCKKNPCKNLPDGEYADVDGACGQYLSCINGWPLVLECELGDQVWNDEQKRCMSRSLVKPPCGDYMATRPTTTTPSTTATPSTSPSTSPSTTRQQPTTTISFCADRLDGQYLPEGSAACSTSYIQCHRGLDTQVQCPNRLSFDESKSACVRVANNPACLNNPCRTLTDGLYSDADGKCSQYLKCSSGWPITIECQSQHDTFADDLVWNDAEKRCMSRSLVAPPCGDYTTTRRTPPTTRATTTSRPTTTRRPNTTEVDPCIHGRPDGGYLEEGVECSTKYIQCHGGVATREKCPLQLSYDPVKGSCVRVSNNPSCKNNPCYVLVDGVYADPEGSCNRYMRCVNGWVFFNECEIAGQVWNQVAKHCSEIDKVPAPCGTFRFTTQAIRTTTPREGNPTTPPSDVSCRLESIGASLSDPIEACSPHYYQCLGNQFAVRRPCAPGTFYDSETEICDFRANVPFCGGVRPTEPAETTTLEPPVTTPGLVFECRAAGMFANPEKPCDDRFVVCDISLIARTMACARGTFFDEELQVCQMSADVPACSGTPRPPPTTQPPTTTTTLPADLRPLTDFVCVKAGLYPNPFTPCSEWFVSCDVGGVARYMRCAGGTYFDLELGVCLYYTDVPECVGTPRPESTIATDAPTTTATTTQQGPTTRPPFNCVRDGNFAPVGQPCATFFWQCHNGGVNRVNCPTTLRFDSNRNSCVRKENNPFCEKNPCEFLVDGLYSDPEGGCSQHMRCVRGWPIFVQCLGAGDVWNDDAKQCMDPALFRGPCGTLTTTQRAVTTATPFCAGRERGNYARPGQPCQTSFYQCHGGHGIDIDVQCGHGLVYDASHNKCVRYEDCRH